MTSINRNALNWSNKPVKICEEWKAYLCQSVGSKSKKNKYSRRVHFLLITGWFISLSTDNEINLFSQKLWFYTVVITRQSSKQEDRDQTGPPLYWVLCPDWKNLARDTIKVCKMRHRLLTKQSTTVITLCIPSYLTLILWTKDVLRQLLS